MTPSIDADTPRVRVIGHRWSPHVHEIKDFLARSRVPYEWLDVERDEGARRRAEQAAPGNRRFPVLIFPSGATLIRPSEQEVAREIGLDTEAGRPFYDLVVVGGGPTGLSAAIYAASEGLHTVVIEGEVPGGQAGQSACIDNYMGFTDGVSGNDLAHRAVAQARRFRAEIVATRRAVALRDSGRYHIVVLDDDRELACHVVLVASGVSYRWLEAPGCPALVGAGVYYGAAAAEASAVAGQDVYVLGGGNAAGQAVLLLARFARRVVMVVLEGSLEESMSRYLIDEIEDTPNVEVRTSSTVSSAEGGKHLDAITIEHTATGEQERACTQALFVFIGGTPDTEWLGGRVALDGDGFVLCGDDLPGGLRKRALPYETSVPGVFAAGDVRHGAVRRLAAAVGEGASVIQSIHQYLDAR